MVCEALSCETAEVLHPHPSNREQVLTEREVGFLRSFNEDTDVVHGCYIQEKHITGPSSLQTRA